LPAGNEENYRPGEPCPGSNAGAIPLVLEIENQGSQAQSKDPSEAWLIYFSNLGEEKK